MMGESPVYSCKAHVFQIDPNTKKSWIPCSKQAVTVSFYYDKTKETHRIISVDGSKAIINSTIFPNMNFTKTSQKFGQWSDPKVNSVFGLGFPTEAELNKFAEMFKEARSSSTSLANTSRPSSGSSSPQTTGTSTQNNLATVSGVRDSPTPQQGTQTSSVRSGSSTSSIEFEKQRSVDADSNHESASRKISLPPSFKLTLDKDESRESPGISHKPVGNTEAHLKYENDRLKMALAQSSTNAKKWETELQTLKNNNARLTAALQESTANVEEWKKQLNAYKEESIRLRKKVQESESSNLNADVFNNVQQEKMALEGRIIHLESVNKEKEEEVTALKHTNNELKNQVKVCRGENEELQQKVKELEDKLRESSINASKADELTSLHQAIQAKLNELNTLNQRIPSIVQN
ncbi:homer protein homolog 2-like isoform X2 [Actinia tenebrosa]|uniref:Homer protein homolog 2-like isoform X2 n=1 Tax=Actinia tenebrosa TaxID=6105 RepID=A0A6P8HP00_ACTTE|nr:homer protein homolog 2-like isoform X2 [Actinia tenebrosa]